MIIVAPTNYHPAIKRRGLPHAAATAVKKKNGIRSEKELEWDVTMHTMETDVTRWSLGSLGVPQHQPRGGGGDLKLLLLLRRQVASPGAPAGERGPARPRRPRVGGVVI
jgi:hypothetical protein